MRPQLAAHAAAREELAAAASCEEEVSCSLGLAARVPGIRCSLGRPLLAARRSPRRATVRWPPPGSTALRGAAHHFTMPPLAAAPCRCSPSHHGARSSSHHAIVIVAQCSSLRCPHDVHAHWLLA
ncbi:hypothetical protein Dimus_000993 [Dionaea muscipula]